MQLFDLSQIPLPFFSATEESKNHEELKNRFKELSDEKLLELYANPELLKKICEDLKIPLSEAFDLLSDYIINDKLNPKQKNIYDRYIEQNSIFEYPTPRVLNAIRSHFKNHLNENIDDLNDSEILATIYIVSLYNKRKENLREYLITLDINTLSDMLDHKLIDEAIELSNKYYVDMNLIDNSIKIEFKNRTVAIRTFLSELDINDLLKFFLSHKTLQYCSDFVIYNKKEINNLNEKRIVDLNKKFDIPKIIITKFISQEYHERIKNLNESLSKYSQSILSKIISRNESIKSLSEKYRLNNEIVIKLIELEISKREQSIGEKKQSNDTLGKNLLNIIVKFLELCELFLYYSNQKMSIIYVLNSCDLELISNSLGLPKEQLNNIIKYISKICDEKASNNELEAKMLNYLIKIADKYNFTQIATKRTLEFLEYNSTVSLIITSFFKEVFEIFPGLKNYKTNPDIIKLELNMLDLLNCDDFDLIANSLDLSIEQFKNICSYIINLSEKDPENKILNFCKDNINIKNLNFQDYNSFVEFFSDLFVSFPNILQTEIEITETHESNNIEPKPELAPNINQQERDK